VLDPAGLPGRAVTAHGSRGLTATPFVQAPAVGVTVLELAAGGEIGRHAAPSEQLLVVLAGDGQVSGADGAWQPVTAGQAVLWSTGEEHATRAAAAMLVLVVEYPGGGDHGTADAAEPLQEA